jgi:hypothetical protein
MSKEQELRGFKPRGGYIDGKRATQEEIDRLQFIEDSRRTVTRSSYRKIGSREVPAVDVIDQNGRQKVFVEDDADPGDGEVDDRGKEAAEKPRKKKSHHSRHKSKHDPPTGKSGRRHRSESERDAGKSEHKHRSHHKRDAGTSKREHGSHLERDAGASGRPKESQSKHRHRTDKLERSHKSDRKHHSEEPERRQSKSREGELSVHGSQILEHHSEHSESSDSGSEISEDPEAGDPEIVDPNGDVNEDGDEDDDSASEVSEDLQSVHDSEPELPVGEAGGHIPEGRRSIRAESVHTEGQRSKHGKLKKAESVHSDRRSHKSKHHKSKPHEELVYVESQVSSPAPSTAPTVTDAGSHRKPLRKSSSKYAGSTADPTARKASRSHRGSVIRRDPSPSPASTATESIAPGAPRIPRTPASEIAEGIKEISKKYLPGVVDYVVDTGKEWYKGREQSASRRQIQSERGGGTRRINSAKPTKSQPGGSSKQRAERPGHRTKGHHSEDEKVQKLNAWNLNHLDEENDKRWK